MMHWSLGFPGWRIAARLGMPIKIKIDIFRDTDAGLYFATCNTLGLAVEAESLDGLMDEIHGAVPVLLELARSSVREPKTDIRLHDGLVTA